MSINVLIVDDNVGDIELIELALRKFAADVHTTRVNDGVSALAQLRDRSRRLPDLILLDLKLPRKGGLEVLVEIKRDRQLRRIPVVVLSSSAHDADIERAYELQACAYFTKPSSSYDEVIPLILRFFGAAKSRPPPMSAKNAGDATRRAEPKTDVRDTDTLSNDVFASLPVAVLSVDENSVITTWNPAAESLFELTRSEALGRVASAIVTAGDRERFGTIIANALRGDPSGDDYVTLRSGNETHRSVMVAVNSMTDEFGRTRGAVIVARQRTKGHLANEIFRLIVERSPTALVMVDEKGQVVLTNAEMERLFGYHRSELIGQPVELLVPDRFRKDHSTFRTSFMHDPTTRAMGAGRELYGQRRDGSELPIEIALTPIESSDGTFVLSAILDVSERRLAEERFRLAVESAPSAMVMVDAVGRIVLVNAETERLFDYERDELIGQSIEKLVPARFRDEHPKHRAQFMDGPRARAMGAGRDLFGVRRDGSEFPVEIGLNPIRTKTDRVVLSSIVDITARKRAEAALADKTLELERSNAELEQFAYVASHDLQEPLRMIASYTQLLREEYAATLDGRGNKFLDYVHGSAMRMQQLIRDLLAFARVNTRSNAPTRVEASEALRVALADLALVIRDAGVNVHSTSMPAVKADASQLAEVFRNLIGNAIKFSSAGSDVSLSSEAAGDKWIFAVRDEGIGIDPEFAERVFNVFERLHPPGAYPGTGMGLAICKRIVERWGGRIWTEPNEGAGSVFYFTLPAAR